MTITDYLLICVIIVLLFGLEGPLKRILSRFNTLIGSKHTRAKIKAMAKRFIGRG